ncbi:MAG: DUF3465 domain-containing protein [Pseudomonadales bacterium]|nr:DUF3465 domain-containing protein [Pseudomonadales bacterium]
MFPDQFSALQNLLGQSGQATQAPARTPTSDAANDNTTGSSNDVAIKGNANTRDYRRLRKAIDEQEFEVWLDELEFEVVKILRDDLEGSRHQRFLVSQADLPTLLVAHNIDLAPRVPLQEGDRVYVRGRYEWNNKGGVLHWTHHDPKGRRQGGWVRYQGKLYK